MAGPNQTRPNSSTLNKHRWPARSLSAADLRRQHWDEGRSCVEIGREIGVSGQTVQRWLRQDGSGVRGRSEAAKAIRRRQRVSVSKFATGLDSEGYRIIASQKQHRMIAEAVLARPLTSVEVVHHVNGCRSDNRPANLWVFPTDRDHMKFHHTGTIHPDTIKLIPYCGEAV